MRAQLFKTLSNIISQTLRNHQEAAVNLLTSAHNYTTHHLSQNRLRLVLAIREWHCDRPPVDLY